MDPLGDLDEIEDVVMVNTASMMLRGLGGYLQQHRNLADAWGPMAREALKIEDRKRKTQRLAGIDAEIASWTAAA